MLDPKAQQRRIEFLQDLHQVLTKHKAKSMCIIVCHDDDIIQLERGNLIKNAYADSLIDGIYTVAKKILEHSCGTGTLAKIDNPTDLN